MGGGGVGVGGGAGGGEGVGGGVETGPVERTALRNMDYKMNVF